MGTTENVQAWSKTAATNSTADAGINWAEGQDPATVNNSARGMMAATKKWAEDTGGARVAGGTANALTVTTAQILSSGQVTDGLRLLLKATADNTSATVTFAPDGLTAANIKRADGSALAVGSIKSGMYLDLVYNSGSSEWRCANILPIGPASGGGLVFLTSGSWSAQATGDIVLTTYTGYRGLRFVLDTVVPVTNAQKFIARFSTDGGSTYITSAFYHWAYSGSNESPASIATGAQDSSIALTTITSNTAGNGGVNTIIDMLHPTLTSVPTKITWQATYYDSTFGFAQVSGGGWYNVAQDTDAIRFLFASGNISTGNYAVYGYA